MKPVGIHRLPDRDVLVRLVEARKGSLERLVSMAALPGRPQNSVLFNDIRSEALFRAQYALILDKAEEQARTAFAVAASFSLRALCVQGPREGYGAARMSFTEFSRCFFTLWAFGEERELVEAARVPEVDYRSPGLVVPEEGLALMEAQKLLALRHFSHAREAFTRLGSALNPRQRAYVGALEAVFEGDRSALEESLLADIKLHRKQAAKTPGDIDGLVCYTSAMVCRVALWHGIVIDDQNYLPLRFMPGHPEQSTSSSTQSTQKSG